MLADYRIRQDRHGSRRPAVADGKPAEPSDDLVANGIVTQIDHVRTAVGRNRLDATPTHGPIFVIGGETLAIEVSVEPHG